MSVLDILKLILSKESRETLGELWDSVKSTPEWKKNILEINQNFTRDDIEYLSQFVDFILEILREKSWGYSKINDVELTCNELLDNAFKHNKNVKKLKVKVKVSISPINFKLSVSDNGKGFDLENKIRKNKNHKGLNIINNISYDFYQESPNEIIARITTHTSKFSHKVENEIGYFCVTGKFDTHIAPDIKSECVLLAGAEKLTSNNIVDLSDSPYMDSSGLSALLVLRRLIKFSHKKFDVVVVATPAIERLLTISQLETKFVIKETISEAFEYFEEKKVH